MAAENVEIARYAGADELAHAAAQMWLTELQRPGQRGRYCVALSGGRIAGNFLSALAASARGDAGRFAAVHFFWGDERCVPPDDPESNFRLAREHLFQPLSIPEDHIHRIRGEDPPEKAVVAAATELREYAGSPASGIPVLDLVLLGLGEDGHVASLFPGEPVELMNSAEVFRAVVGSKPPPRRISLGYRPLAVADKVWVLASGAGKENALRESLSPGGRTPLARVLNSRKHTKIFTDIPLTDP